MPDLHSSLIILPVMKKYLLMISPWRSKEKLSFLPCVLVSSNMMMTVESHAICHDIASSNSSMLFLINTINILSVSSLMFPSEVSRCEQGRNKERRWGASDVVKHNQANVNISLVHTYKIGYILSMSMKPSMLLAWALSLSAVKKTTKVPTSVTLVLLPYRFLKPPMDSHSLMSIKNCRCTQLISLVPILRMTLYFFGLGLW